MLKLGLVVIDISLDVIGLLRHAVQNLYLLWLQRRLWLDQVAPIGSWLSKSALAVYDHRGDCLRLEYVLYDALPVLKAFNAHLLIIKQVP